MSWQNWQESHKEQLFDMRRKAGTALLQRSIRLDARYTSALARLFFLWTEHEKSRPSGRLEETKKAVGWGHRTARRYDGLDCGALCPYLYFTTTHDANATKGWRCCWLFSKQERKAVSAWGRRRSSRPSRENCSRSVPRRDAARAGDLERERARFKNVRPKSQKSPVNQKKVFPPVRFSTAQPPAPRGWSRPK